MVCLLRILWCKANESTSLFSRWYRERNAPVRLRFLRLYACDLSELHSLHLGHTSTLRSSTRSMVEDSIINRIVFSIPSTKFTIHFHLDIALVMRLVKTFQGIFFGRWALQNELFGIDASTCCVAPHSVSPWAYASDCNSPCQYLLVT